jgi:hypothetical protein
MDTVTLVLRIVAKALRGEPIERGDVDMTDKQWEAVWTPRS